MATTMCDAQQLVLHALFCSSSRLHGLARALRRLARQANRSGARAGLRRLRRAHAAVVAHEGAVVALELGAAATVQLVGATRSSSEGVSVERVLIHLVQAGGVREKRQGESL